MSAVIISGTNMPEPTSIAANNELIWSSDTGRTLSGIFVGSLIGEKTTFQVEWTNLTTAEYEIVKRNLSTKYMTVNILGEICECYHGTIARKPRADASGYYGSVSVDLIER